MFRAEVFTGTPRICSRTVANTNGAMGPVDTMNLLYEDGNVSGRITYAYITCSNAANAAHKDLKGYHHRGHVFSICSRAYACAQRPGLPRGCHSGVLTCLALLGRGTRVACVPRLRLRQSFSRTLLAHAIWRNTPYWWYNHLIKQHQAKETGGQQGCISTLG